MLTKNEFFKGGEREGGGRKYYNQPTIAKVGENQFALMAIESNGMGKNTNIKGANTAHMMMLERNGDSLIAGGEIVGAAAHQTHASICVGGYGEQGNTAVGVFSASPTGIGRAAMAMVQYDNMAKSFKYDEKADLWPAAWYGDSGHLANIYGRNPMRQGRDFMRCIGGIENPGYHQPNGYMADVKSFFAAAVHGRVPGDEKNSLFLSLVPGQMDKKPIPANPVPAGEEPNLDPNASAITNNAPKSDSGCGCATPGTNNTTDTAALAGLALGLGLVISRRRRSQ
jgi:MYXO-CTERM domain-containing protein